MDFFFFLYKHRGTVKDRVFERKPHTLGKLKKFISQECMDIEDEQNLCYPVTVSGSRNFVTLMKDIKFGEFRGFFAKAPKLNSVKAHVCIEKFSRV